MISIFPVGGKEKFFDLRSGQLKSRFVTECEGVLEALEKSFLELAECQHALETDGSSDELLALLCRFVTHLSPIKLFDSLWLYLEGSIQMYWRQT